MSNLYYWVKGLGIAISGAIVISGNSAIAQINHDVTLTNNSSVATQENIRIIEGGIKSGSNLSHSFKQFSVPAISTVYCKNTADIQNIISLVTNQKYGISADAVQKIQHSIDQSQIQDEDCSDCTCTCWSRTLRKWVPCSCT
ncbi:hypothetical protein HUN01_29445 [Nostoc edaphicum CCNP1411]|uniref:Filamentous haemagglutinin FhaB/tRNA nuclease CdiA-like TPS domain-containing protein n=1 Tax=Nostoc edaphicum CCNP1411 TaxID=1472755 RepID=A0A7D7QIP6_9NOSO|nr:hypothetical protein [Nostoc edaphicum]QMS91522.1 hypothetical protein HUN01_29445 [Nostoc edaphicum CCNP1411]